MLTVKTQLTVLFEDPFWIGVFERESDGAYSVCKITYGAEPSNAEVYLHFLDNRHAFSFTPSMEVAAIEERKRNPKRMQREAQKAVQNTGVGTKAQQALKLQQEEGKLARKVRTKAEREAEAAQLFALRQQKRKEKHRGH